jgi:putative spermidine/putrescine transport system substrate-binding protein
MKRSEFIFPTQAVAESPTRQRHLVLWLLIIGLLSLATGCQKQQLVIASYGGAWQDVQRAVMFQPFSKAKSIPVRDVVYDGQYAKIKEMVDARRVEWDLVDVEGNMVRLGARDQILEPIDYSVVQKSGFIDGATAQYGVGIVAWSWVLAYRRGSLNPEQYPNPWVAFFDPKAIPGPRGMRNDPRRTLEIALLADGVPPASLYPLDIDRAFRVLTQFRSAMDAAKSPIVWWDEYAKPAQLLRDGEVVLTPGANGRIVDAQKEGAPIDYVWNGGIVDLDWWVVPRGSRNKQLAMEFISFASSPSVQGSAVQKIPYGPVAVHAFDELSPAVARGLPTYPENLKKQITFNTEWWATNLDRVQERWNQWRTSK